MTIRINYLKKTIRKPSSNLVLFSNDKFNVSGLKQILSKPEYLYISDLLKTSDLKKNL